MVKFSRIKTAVFLLYSLSLILCYACLTGCSSDELMAEQSGEKINIVTTTTMLADLAQEIGGDTVNVKGLMGSGVDPHLYQASAGDVIKLQEADVVIYNGLHLEGKMGDIFASLESQNKNVICIENSYDKSDLLSIDGDENFYDPHVWFDVSLWQSAARYVAEKLSALSPDNKEIYQENLETYLLELTALNDYIFERVSELPDHQRVLITAHDAFQYFGNAYGFNVKGLQGISTDAEAGTADVINLAQFIAENKIKAIFIESSIPPKTIEALQASVHSKGFEVAIGGELYSDSLGDENSGTQTYILTVKSNIDTIVDALK